MATTTQHHPTKSKTKSINPSKSFKVCFSFAAYAKSVIASLQSSDVHVTTPGLTDLEITAIESAAGFTFPPDLRSILSEGLPVGPGFPNWRSSSPHQLRLLSTLPVLSLSKEVSNDNFWAQSSWGPRPSNDEEAVSLARKLLGRAPALVPVFKNCYIPSRPNLAGNPVFYVHGGDVRLVSADVGGFFKEIEFWKKGLVFKNRKGNINVDDDEVDGNDCFPAWAAARRVEFWTEASEMGPTRRRWWWSDRVPLGECLDDVMWRLREGGWGEDDVREMMMMNNDYERAARGMRRVDREGVVRHVRRLSKELLRGGWSIDDVVYSLGDQGEGRVENGVLDGESWLDFQCPSSNQIALLMGR